MTLRDHVQGKAKFQRYQNGELWYKTATGFEFPIPTNDTGNGVLRSEEKGILFMRWIRIHMDMLTAARQGESRPTAEIKIV